MRVKRIIKEYKRKWQKYTIPAKASVLSCLISIIGALIFLIGILPFSQAKTETGGEDIQIHEKEESNEEFFQIVVMSDPTGVKVYIDEKFIGLTDRTLTLPKGKHEIKLKKMGYKDIHDIIEIPGQKILSVVLEKE